MKTLVAILVVGCVAAAPAKRAHAEPLWDAQLRVGYGVAVEAASGMASSTKTSPLEVEAMVGFALNEEPLLYGYAGVIAETMRRGDVGGLAGVEYKPTDSRMRFTAGAAWIYAPKTLWGATASAGACTRGKSSVQYCADLEMKVYLAGSGLEMGHEITQVQLAFGFTFGGQP